MIRLQDLKNKYRNELQLLEVPEIDRGNFVIQYHIRGIGYRPSDNLEVKEGDSTKKVQIEDLLKEERWKGCQVRYNQGNDFIEEVLNYPKGSRWEEIEDIVKEGEYTTDEGEDFELYNVETESCDRFSLLGSSTHQDWRFEMDDYLLGITVLDPGRTADPSDLSNKDGMNGNKILVKSKAKEPKQWMDIAGNERGDSWEVDPGEIGATKWTKGLFIVLTRGEWEPGAIKPYYVEFFPYTDELDGRWNVRETGLPAGGTDIPEEERDEVVSWLLWKPEDQVPYAVSDRAKKKEWIPPENLNPVPTYWKEDNPDKYEEWQEWVKDIRGKEGRANLEELDKINFKLKYVWWKGQFVIRGTRRENFYLVLDTEDGYREWSLNKNPLYNKDVGSLESKSFDSRYWDKTGEIEPETRYNPNKEIKAHMEDLAKGKVDIEKVDTESEKEKFKLDFTGKLKGTWILEPSTEGSQIWSFKKTGEGAGLANPSFTIQSHTIDGKTHYDLSLQVPGQDLEDGFRKFAMWGKPTDVKEGGRIECFKEHICEEPKWFKLDDMAIPPENAPDWLKEGNPSNGMAYVDLLDKGTYQPINWSDRWISLKLDGDKIEGYYGLKKQGDTWYFLNAQKPKQENIAGDPRDEPFWEVEEEDENILVSPFRERFFSSLIPTRNNERYELPDTSDDVDLVLGKYPKPETVGIVRIVYIRFPKESWEPEEALEWCKENNLDEFKTKYIKEG